MRTHKMPKATRTIARMLSCSASAPSSGPISIRKVDITAVPFQPPQMNLIDDGTYGCLRGSIDIDGGAHVIGNTAERDRIAQGRPPRGRGFVPPVRGKRRA